jgi:hypothetical protein
MTNIHNTMPANIAADIAKVQNLCRGTKKYFFDLWKESGMDFNHLVRVLLIMVEGKMITKHGEGMCDEAYSY